MARGRFASPSVDLLLLGFFLDGPSHGYELHQRMKDMPGLERVWSLKQPLLYAKLDALEKAGLLARVMIKAPAGTPPRKYYGITDKARDAFELWIREPVRHLRDIRLEFLVKLLYLHAYRVDLLDELLEAQRLLVLQWRDDLHRRANAATGADNLVSLFRSKQIEAILEWLASIGAGFPATPDDE